MKHRIAKLELRVRLASECHDPQREVRPHYSNETAEAFRHQDDLADALFNLFQDKLVAAQVAPKG